MTVDPLDLALVREFGLPFDGVRRHPSELRAAALARRIRTSAPTVRERMARMRESGFLAGFALVPNPRLGGESPFATFYELDPRTKDAAIARATEADGVLHVISFGGVATVVTSTARDEAHARERVAIQERAIGTPCRWHVLVDHHRRDPPPMRPLDWRILAALHDDALRDLDAVASQVGVTRRTVKSRLDRMVREECVILMAVLDRTRLPGALFHWVLVTQDPTQKAAVESRVVAALGDRCLGTRNPPADAEHTFVNAWSPSAGDAEDLRLRVAAIPGVRATETLVMLGTFPGTKPPLSAPIIPPTRLPSS